MTLTFRALFQQFRQDLQSQPGRWDAAWVLGEAMATVWLFMVWAALAFVMGGA